MRTNFAWILMTLAIGTAGGLFIVTLVTDQPLFVKMVAGATVAVAGYFTLMAIRETVNSNYYLRMRKNDD